MRISEFIKLDAESLDLYLSSRFQNIEHLNNHNLPGILGIIGLPNKNPLFYYKKRKIIKKIEVERGGLGGISITPSLDLYFFDFAGKTIGAFWRYRGICPPKLSGKTKDGDYYPVETIKEMFGDEVD